VGGLKPKFLSSGHTMECQTARAIRGVASSNEQLKDHVGKKKKTNRKISKQTLHRRRTDNKAVGMILTVEKR